MKPLRVLLVPLSILAFGYLVLLGLLYTQQRALIYQPQWTRAPALAADFTLPVEDAVLRGWVANPGRAVALLYFGGNAEDVSLQHGDFAQWFPGHTVYLVAYRGFGLSTGEPSEQALREDGIALFDHLAARYAAVDVLGRSLGSAVAVQVAARRPVRRLALVTPFDSMVRLAQDIYPWVPVDWLLADRFYSVDLAYRLDMPIKLVIAGRDGVVPAERSLALLAALPQAPRLLRIEAAGHNDLDRFAAYAQGLRDFFNPEASRVEEYRPSD